MTAWCTYSPALAQINSANQNVGLDGCLGSELSKLDLDGVEMSYGRAQYRRCRVVWY